MQGVGALQATPPDRRVVDTHATNTVQRFVEHKRFIPTALGLVNL